MKKTILFVSIVFITIAFYSCENCECDCKGEVFIFNNSGVDYSFEIRKSNTVVFKGTIKDPDDIHFGLEEGNFTLAYGEQSLNLEKSFTIVDCEETTVFLGN